MKRINILYYLLIVWLVLGTFAAMAQNNYGQLILGLVAFGFSLVFIYHTLQQLLLKNKPFWGIAETVSLAILALVLGMRVFYFYFPFVEILFILAGLGLTVIYGRELFSDGLKISWPAPIITKLKLGYYGSVVAYLLSLIFMPFFSTLSFGAGVIGTLFVACSAWFVYNQRTIVVEGEEVNSLRWVSRRKDHSSILLIIFLLFTFYQAMITTTIFPAMYNDEMPQVYYQLIEKEGPVINKREQTFTHEEFKRYYDQIVERHPVDKK